MLDRQWSILHFARSIARRYEPLIVRVLCSISDANIVNIQGVASSPLITEAHRYGLQARIDLFSGRCEGILNNHKRR